MPGASEDELYRALFTEGGHLERFGLGSLLRAIYSQASLKLMGFADWPAGFTFFEERERLRQFIYAVSTGSRVCSHCGAGDVEPSSGSDSGKRWVCRARGHTMEPRAVRLDALDRLETEMQSLTHREEFYDLVELPDALADHNALPASGSGSTIPCAPIRRSAIARRRRSSASGKLSTHLGEGRKVFRIYWTSTLP